MGNWFPSVADGFLDLGDKYFCKAIRIKAMSLKKMRHRFFGKKVGVLVLCYENVLKCKEKKVFAEQKYKKGNRDNLQQICYTLPKRRKLSL